MPAARSRSVTAGYAAPRAPAANPPPPLPIQPYSRVSQQRSRSGSAVAPVGTANYKPSYAPTVSYDATRWASDPGVAPQPVPHVPVAHSPSRNYPPVPKPQVTAVQPPAPIQSFPTSQPPGPGSAHPSSRGDTPNEEAQSAPKFRQPCELNVHIGEVIANRYKLTEVLGSGCFGQVFKAQDTKEGRFVALKISSASSDRSVRLTERELEHLQMLDHPNVVTYLDCGRHSNAADTFLVIVLEFYSGGCLKNKIHYRQITDQMVMRIAADMAAALECVHHHDIVHGDLKSANVLFDKTGRAILCDFGTSRKAGIDIRRVVMNADLWYVPPEAQKPGTLSTTYDFWSLGILYVELVTQELTCLKYTEFKPISQFPSIVTEMTTALQTQREGMGSDFVPLLSYDPDSRPTAASVLALCKDRRRRAEWLHKLLR